MEEIADLLHEDNELIGEISFKLEDEQLLDQSIKNVTVFYKLVGASRFKLFRNNEFELVFVHLTEDWMRQAKVALKDVDYNQGIHVTLAWNEKEDTVSVRSLSDEKDSGLTVQAIQIDN